MFYTNSASIVILAVIVLLCAAGIRSYRKKLSSGCCGSGGDAVKAVRAADTDIRHYAHHKTAEIDGMVCANCAKRVANAFNVLPGTYAAVNAAKKTAEIYTHEPLADDKIRSIVSGAGYMALKIHTVK